MFGIHHLSVVSVLSCSICPIEREMSEGEQHDSSYVGGIGAGATAGQDVTPSDWAAVLEKNLGKRGTLGHLFAIVHREQHWEM